MLFENLTISRLVIHQVLQRSEDRNIGQTRYGTSLTILGPADSSALHDRIIAALGSVAKCMEFNVSDTGAGGMLDISRKLIDADDTDFVHGSKEVVNKLAKAQTSRRIPGGVLVVWCGSTGYPAQRMIGVIKAEFQSGFTFKDGESMTLEFMRNLFLTPHARFYKIGAFVEVGVTALNTKSWKAFVYDDAMTAENRDAAAQYFYETFLGCSIPQNSARQTKLFFELTKDFINKLNIPDNKKVDLGTALYSYLKVDQAPTVDTGTFANRFLDSPSMRDAYGIFMKQNNFPSSAISKDLSGLKGRLRRRKITFKSDIQLSATVEDFENLVTVEALRGDILPDGSRSEWTQITVRDRIRSQE